MRFLELTGIRGRDGSTTSVSKIPPHRVSEALNVDWYRAAFGRKRGGAIAHSLAGSGLTGVVVAGCRHVPGADETAAELWLADDAGNIARYAAGAWSNPTKADAISGSHHEICFCSFNGKLYIAYDSAVDRLHVWDPVSNTIRRTGLAVATGFTSADLSNTGAGTYPATQRWYRIRVTEQRSGSTYRRSSPTDAVAFTPSGTGTAARFTFSGITSPGEGDTHWEIEGSAIGSSGPFYVLATVSIGTATYDDSVNPSAYSSGTASDVAGYYTNWTSVKYLIADDNRMLGAGAWESGNPVNTVYATPVLGTTSPVFFDDERVPTGTANRVEFNEKDSGSITGFGGPLENQVIVTKNRQLWRLIPTGVASAPYRRKPITRVIGSLRHQFNVMAEDDAGHPAFYFVSHKGPYRLSVNGLENMVRDVKDVWLTFNKAATGVLGCAVYHEDIHQLWVWLATGASNNPDVKLVFDTELGHATADGIVRDGWAKHTGESAKAKCAFMFSATIAASMSRDLKPYIGQHGGNTRFWKCDTTDLDDDGTAFQGLITVPDRHIASLSRRVRAGNPIVLGSAGSYTLSVSYRTNYGEETLTDSASMAAVGSETRVVRVIEGAERAGVFAVAVQVGDASAVASVQWTIDEVSVPYEGQEKVAA